MRLESLEVTGYQGLNFLSLEFPTPVTLIAGKNATGKTSIKDAVEFAFTGLSRRVSLKKNYDQLVRVGSEKKNSGVKMVVDGFTFTRKTATGKAGHEEKDTPIVLPHLLGSSRFALLPHAEQSKLLFEVSRTKRDVATIKAMMLERGVEPKCVDQAMTMVRAGFAAAVKSCKSEQSTARGRWEGITGDRFGEAKAVNWVAKAPEDAPDLVQAKAAKAEIDKALPEEEAALFLLTETCQALHAQSLTLGSMECPACKVKLKVDKGALIEGATDIDPEKLQADIKAANDKRDLKATEVRGFREAAANIRAEIALAENAEANAALMTKGAKAALNAYGAWKKAAEALAPTGIPLQLLEKGLKPINDRLAVTCVTAGWKPIVINSDLSITYGGIEYGLCSESEQWRIDAGIAECFSVLSNVKLFVLDRMDVLHPYDRSAVINWLVTVAPEHDSIIVLATLKVKPEIPNDAITTYWLEEGNQA